MKKKTSTFLWYLGLTTLTVLIIFLMVIMTVEPERFLTNANKIILAVLYLFEILMLQISISGDLNNRKKTNHD